MAGTVVPVRPGYLQRPLGLQLPEQQSSSALHDSFLPAHPDAQTSPAAQLGEPSALLHCHWPSEQQVWPSKQKGLPPTPGSSSGLQQAAGGAIIHISKNKNSDHH